MYNSKQIDKLIDNINKANTIAIISHVNIDGDTMGAGLALYKALKMYAKSAYIFCDDKIPHKLSYLGSVDVFNSQQLDKYDMAIAVDCATLDRLGNCQKEFNKAKVTANIDHHITNSRYANINVVTDCAATCELLYGILKRLGDIDSDIAKALMCGLVTDSGIFSYSSVSAHTFEVASELMGYGINHAELCEKVFKAITIDAFRLKARAMEKAKFYCDNRAVISIITNKDFADTNSLPQHTEGIVSILREVEGVDVAITIAQVSDMSYKISFRTSEKVDATRIAMVFGGGGHIRAAGCRLNGYCEEVLERVLKAVSDEIC